MSLKGPIISVEDDEDDQYLIGETLKNLGVPNEVRFFPNGEAALQYLETTTEQPFLILCDINMPLMNGLELRQRILANQHLAQKAIPFIFLTTAATPQIIRTAYDATVQGFYKKATDYASMQHQLKLIIDYWQHCMHPTNPV
ncbi:response regulator [Rudanella paleaurantiibacter]|uniref:Response regulator n=1 Tax=Rudanella paleaurantiibacter TaxID=2614655 RepID=A0A7J5U673_9BACT|nr:response regulator [Rudanella paleaurantiibacter]KAB7733151.1 response regulator [Rudanella paleaurantiibacter]